MEGRIGGVGPGHSRVCLRLVEQLHRAGFVDDGGRGAARSPRTIAMRREGYCSLEPCRRAVKEVKTKGNVVGKSGSLGRY